MRSDTGSLPPPTAPPVIRAGQAAASGSCDSHGQECSVRTGSRMECRLIAKDCASLLSCRGVVSRCMVVFAVNSCCRMIGRSRVNSPRCETRSDRLVWHKFHCGGACLRPGRDTSEGRRGYQGQPESEGQQDRKLRMPEQKPGRSAEDRLVELGMAVGTHDD
jgi:hypothetical protein